MGYADQTPPGLRVDAIPARLHSRNRIHLVIVDSYRWNTYYLFWTENGGPEQTTRLPGSSSETGTVDYDFFADAGSDYSFQVQGCPVDIGGPAPPDDGHCSPRSYAGEATAFVNETSVRNFLRLSGVAIDTNSVSLRALAPPASVRALLNGE
jgi:hypothetical protein